eukprot:12883448-Prorocentrum_lima.AAC.1
MSGMTNRRNTTFTTTDIANAFRNAPINKDTAILVAVPNILARLGIVEAGTVWRNKKQKSCIWAQRKSQTMAGRKRP